jgi:hypothetical protein
VLHFGQWQPSKEHRLVHEQFPYDPFVLYVWHLLKQRLAPAGGDPEDKEHSLAWCLDEDGCRKPIIDLGLNKCRQNFRLLNSSKADDPTRTQIYLVNNLDAAGKGRFTVRDGLITAPLQLGDVCFSTKQVLERLDSKGLSGLAAPSAKGKSSKSGRLPKQVSPVSSEQEQATS